MWLALLFLSACLVFGYAVSLKFSFVDRLYKRVCFSILVGALAGTIFVFPVSWLNGSLTPDVIGVCIVVLGSTGIFLLEKIKYRKESWQGPWVLFGLFFLLFFALNFFLLLNPAPGGAQSGVNVWGDYFFHFSLIQSFSVRNNFPPVYPMLYGQPLGYPFLVDFLSAVLRVSGFDLRWAVLVPNVLFFMALVLALFWLAMEFSGDEKVAALVLFLVLFNGNFGIVHATSDFFSGRFSFPPGLDYGHDESAGLYFMNLVSSIFMPQRSSLFGIPVLLLVFVLLFRNFDQRLSKDELRLAGVLSGLLVLVHLHSFFFSIGLAGVLFLFKPDKRWLYFFAPCLALALPQLWLFSSQLSGQVIGLQWGWLEANAGKSLVGLAVFWVKNAWVVLVLSVLALGLLNGKQLRFYVPFVLAFLLANVVRFQPWDWDNIKFFVPWFILASILASMFLVRTLATKKWVTVQNALLSLIVLLSIGTGVLTVSWLLAGDHARFVMLSDSTAHITDWILTNTPPSAVFFTSDAYDHPVPSLAGRQTVVGYLRVLWSHGLSDSSNARLADVRSVYCGLPTIAASVMRSYGAEYVFLGSSEKSKYSCSHPFVNSIFFSKVYDADGTQIYRLNP